MQQYRQHLALVQRAVRKVAGDEVIEAAEDGLLSFEVKLTFMISILFFYPICLCIQLHAKPSVRYWVGNWILWVGIFTGLWLLACHFALVARMLKKSNAALVMVIIPGTSLAIACQAQELHFRSVSAALLSQDCTSFPSKARLERAWTSVHDLALNCSDTLSGITGASPEATQRVLRVEDCHGYAREEERYAAEWNYLTYMEREHHCGGWCEPSRPVWHPSEPVQDSCSKAAARVMGGSIARMGQQVTVYSTIMLLCASLSLLVVPSLLGASRLG